MVILRAIRFPQQQHAIMPTRLRRPSIVKQLGITALLVGFQAYLGYSAISGQYGIVSRQALQEDIADLETDTARLQAEIDEYRSRTALFDPKKLDPDILTERAMEVLAMVHEDDRVIIPAGHEN